MRRFFTLLFISISFVLNAQTIILDEDFNNCQIPDTWQINLTGNQNAVWYVSDEIDNPNSDGTTIDGTCMLVFDDDATGNNTDDWNLQLTTPAFDATAFSTINFSVDVHFRNYVESYFRISVFDGNDFIPIVTWQDNINTGVQFSEFVNFTADLSFYANPNMQIRFEYDDGQDWVWWAGMDNVLVTGEGDATNIITNDFNNCSIPTGWTTAILQGEDDWQFGISNNGNAGTNNSMNGTCFALFDDDGLGEENPPSRAALISPPFAGTDYANITLDFDLILRRFEDNEHLGVYIFDGENSQNVVNYFTDIGGPLFNEFVHERIDLSSFRQEQMRVVFLYDDGGGWGWWAGLDNIKISGSGSLNDLCENAIDISLNQTCLSGNNQNALFLGDQPSCDTRNEGALWYRYVAPSTGITEVVTNAAFNDIITIFSGSCGAQNELFCHDRDEQGFDGENLHFTATANEEYYIRISGKGNDFGVPRGDLCLQLKSATGFPTAATNDPCSAAIPLGIAQDCQIGINRHANMDGDFPALNTLSRADIWYSFTANNQAVDILSQSDFADVITLYSGECGNLTEVISNDYGRKLRADNLNAGQEYFIQISGFFATIEGNVCVQIMPIEENTPQNDDCPDAIALTLGADCYAGNNHGATQSDLRPGCETEYDASVWFEFIAPVSGAVKISTGADFVHAISIYQGSCSSLEEVFCTNNPLACEGYFKVGSLSPDETYYMQLSSASDHLGMLATGEYCLSIIDGSEMTSTALDLNVGVECTGSGTGILSIAAIGGTGNYSFQGTPNGQILTTGTSYLVIVSDDSGCEVSVSGVANCGAQDCLISATLAAQNISCFGELDGSASVEIENENGSLAYLWSNEATTAQITNLAAGTYTVTVTDDTGCSAISEAIIYEPAALESNSTASPETAYETNDGTVNVAPIGGTPPYLYQWSNGSTAQSQNGLAPATYTVTVTDANQCQDVQSLVVEAFDCIVAADISKENITCFGENNGTARVDFSVGTAPYVFNWSNGATTQEVTNLSSGVYSVTATDANNCPLILTIEIEEPANLAANLQSTGVSAINTNDGTATANPIGGTAPFSYLWNNEATTEQINNLAPGNYTVTVTDANDCIQVETITVSAFDCAVAASISTSNVSCFGAVDGSASVLVTGGIAPFQYAWSSSGTLSEENNLAAGNYTVTITDAADCPSVLSFTITEPNALSLNITNQENPECPNETGSISVQGQGGTGEYNYLWESGNTATTETNLPTGTYSITLSDLNNCTYIQSFEIIAEDNLNPVASSENITVALDENGIAIIDVNSIDNGSSDNCGDIETTIDINNFTCDNLGANTVTLTVTDEVGNSASTMATVTVIDNIPPQILCPENIVAPCDGYTEYAIPTATDNCGTSTPLLISGLGSGNVFPQGESTEVYQVSDSAGNLSECEFTIIVDNPLSTNIEVEKPTCFGDADGSATVFAEGGNDLSYQWDDAAQQTTATAQNLSAGVYSVTVTDGAGCSITQTIVVPEPDALAINVTEIVNDSNNQGTGSISVEVSGGEMPYMYEWTTNGEFYSDAPNLNDLSMGQYVLQITDANDCVILSETITVDSETSLKQVRIAQYFEVFPNPSTGKFFVQIGLPSVEEVALTIYDIAGKEIEIRKIGVTQQELVSFDLTRLVSGVYEIRAIVGEEVAVFKLVKI